MTSVGVGYRLLLFVAHVITPVCSLVMASMTCWSAPGEGDALGLDDGDVVGDGVGETVGEADGETGTSAAHALQRHR